MENVKKVKAGELDIRNDSLDAMIKCAKFLWPKESFNSVYLIYCERELEWRHKSHTNLPTILATELLKEIEAGEQTPESRISELTAQKEAIEAEIEKLKAESKKFNAERALAGEPCETISGVKVSAIHRNTISNNFPLYGLLDNGGVCKWDVDGFLYLTKQEHFYNLKMS